MRENHRPHWISKWLNHWHRNYIHRVIRPQFDEFGCCPQIHQPKHLKIFGRNIRAGNYLHIVASATQPVKLTTWKAKQYSGHISLGDYCLIAPGVELTSACSIRIGHNSMIATGCILSDSDWHGLYNRIRPFRCTQPIVLEDNVWVGARAIICKGVTIGENSVIGTGAVVTQSIPANCVAAGNPAKVVKQLNPKRRMLKREYLFERVNNYWEQQEEITHFVDDKNTLWKWVQSLVFPTQQD